MGKLTLKGAGWGQTRCSWGSCVCSLSLLAWNLARRLVQEKGSQLNLGQRLLLAMGRTQESAPSCSFSRCCGQRGAVLHDLGQPGACRCPPGSVSASTSRVRTAQQAGPVTVAPGGSEGRREVTEGLRCVGVSTEQVSPRLWRRTGCWPGAPACSLLPSYPQVAGGPWQVTLVPRSGGHVSAGAGLRGRCTGHVVLPGLLGHMTKVRQWTGGCGVPSGPSLPSVLSLLWRWVRS